MAFTKVVGDVSQGELHCEVRYRLAGRTDNLVRDYFATTAQR